jgi:porin
MIGIYGVRIIRPIVFLSAGVFLLVALESRPCLCQMTLSLIQYSSGAHQEVAEQESDGNSGCLPMLKKIGLNLHLNYTGETFHGFRVEPPGDTEYRGLLELEASLDTGKASLWPGGELFIEGQNGHGKGFTVNPGGISLPLSDIGAPDFTQVSEYGLKQDFMDGSVRMILAKQNVNDYFSVNRFGGFFIFPAYTLIPTVPMPTFPAPALGISLFVEPTEWLSLGGGVYDGAPEIERLGFDTAFDGKGGSFSILELTYKAGPEAHNGYNGHYSLGIWYHSGDFAETDPASGSGTRSGNYGWYLMLDHLLLRETASKSNDQGLGAFFQCGWAPDDRNAVTKHVGAGFTYRGLFPNRDADQLGIGLSYTWLVEEESTAGARAHLTNTELYYTAQVNHWMSLQPDIQYCDNPGESRKNGFAVGIRWIVSY